MMDNPPRPDGGANQPGWAVARTPHRCSHQFCENPGVLVYWSAVGGYGWSAQSRHWRGRYSCAEHIAQWWPHVHYDVDAGTIWWEDDLRGRVYLAGPIPAA
jgi:hypothetical protein